MATEKVAQPSTQTKALAPLDEVKGSLAKMEDQFAAALPQQIDKKKFVRVAQTAISTNPLLVQADRRTLYAAIMKSAQDGLLPDGREAALVTFKTKNDGVVAQYMPMVSGILKKIRNSGELASIATQVVHENDVFKYWVDGDGEHLLHEPNMFAERGEIKGVYALARLKDGSVYIEVMTMKDIEKIRNSSRAKEGGPWSQWWSEMARKSAIRRLSKRLPMSTDLEGIVTADDDLYDLQPEPTPEPTPEPKTKPSRLAKIVEAKTTPAPEVVLPPSMDEAEEIVTEHEDIPI
jgi:recombination protein RecT